MFWFGDVSNFIYKELNLGYLLYYNVNIDNNFDLFFVFVFLSS